MKNQRSHIRPHFALILALVGLISAGILVLRPARLASAQVVAPSWTTTGSLNTRRESYTATLMSNGKVLVTGGTDPTGYNPFNTAELYDPATGTWSYTGNLNTGRFRHTATLLPNGKVLVAGGAGDCTPNGGCRDLKSAELYNPATGTWSITGNLNTFYSEHTATLLQNGNILVAQGSAELYDPTTGTWSYTGGLNTLRVGHNATLLTSGKVLVTGGKDNFNLDGDPLNSAELYDPNAGKWTTTGNLNQGRAFHTATLLPNGKVLIVGVDGAELYDPITGTWSGTGNPASGMRAVLLSNDKVLVAGGGSNGNGKSAELYDPATETWSHTASLNIGYPLTATLLLNGKVLVTEDSAAELYDPGTNSINPIDDTQFFVRQHYLDFLNREPDHNGWDYWTDRITQCGSDARCIHDRRIGVSAAFFIEQEFQDSGYYVYRFYKASFGRQPNYSEFTSDRSRVIGGSTLESNKQAFAGEWVQRSAFRDAYPNTMSNTEVVNKLFDSAGLTASRYDLQRQQEIQAMNAGRSPALVLRDVIEIPDFRNVPDPNDPRYSEIKQVSQYNPAFVLMQYFGYLRRNVDRGGYDFWLDIVNNRQPNNYHGMVCSFITSTEYQLRFGSVITRSNADCGQ